VQERRGSGFLGLPAMIGLLAIVAFAKTSIGILGAIAGVAILYVVIGIVIWAGKRRPNP
jgi:hypothetical protein